MQHIFEASLFLCILYELSDFEGFIYFLYNKGSVFFQKHYCHY